MHLLGTRNWNCKKILTSIDIFYRPVSYPTLVEIERSKNSRKLYYVNKPNQQDLYTNAIRNAI